MKKKPSVYTMLTVTDIKKDFPIFRSNPGLVYLDSTATSLKPKSVVDKMLEYYQDYSANVFRGIYRISERATLEYEKTREVVASFINAASSDEIVFTRNTTESLNLIAYSLGRTIIQKDDEIVTTVMEHHSNFVPWQQLAFENEAVFKVIDIHNSGRLKINENNIEEVVSKKSKILALTYVSNVLGVTNPIAQIIRMAKRINPKIIVVVDAAQAAPHRKVDVQALGCDFLAFSSHKMLGPTGVGVLWGKKEILELMPPFLYGGEMISTVSLEKTEFQTAPHKFEAGTPHIAGVIALKAAIYYLGKIGLLAIEKHEGELANYAIDRMKEEFGTDVRIIGDGLEGRGGIVTFTFSSYHPHDIAQILDEENIAIRAGHHCAMPLHTRLKIPSSGRASFYIYNDRNDVEKLIKGLEKVKAILK